MPDQASLFGADNTQKHNPPTSTAEEPLAARMRPRSLDEIVGQEHLLGAAKVVRGVVTLIGATTENPSFEVNAALLSRTRVFVLHGLSERDILTLLQRALHDTERGVGRLNITIDEDALQQIAVFANGDARIALNVLELAAFGSKDANENVVAGPAPARKTHVTLAMIEDVMQHRALLYDKG